MNIMHRNRMAVLLMLTLLGAGPARKAAEWLRRGNEAFTNGDYQGALALYTQAEETTTDPGLVAFNKGAASYRLGRYQEAESYYRRSHEDAAGARLARVLFDLGNTVLRQGRDQDVKQIERAIGYYEECLRQQDVDSELNADARFNLQLARSLLAKARAAPSRDREDTNGGGGQPKGRHDFPGSRGSDSRPGTGTATPVDQRPGRDTQRAPGQSSQEPPPGVGNEPPIQDTDDLVPLSPEDTARYLEQVARRVLRERREHRRRSLPASSRNVMDW